MTRSEVAYQTVGRGGDDSGGSTGENSEDKYKPTQHNENNHHHKEKQELSQSPRTKPKRCLESDDVIVEEEEDIDDDLDSNNSDPPSTSSSKGRKSVIRRTMSFLVTLPRKLYSYVRGVFYTPPQQPWTRVGHDRESEDSDWSSSEDGVTSRLNKARHERRSAGKSRDRHKPKTNKATPPPVAPKPKKRNNPSPSGSSNPPSSPDTTSPDTTPEISFDDIVVEPPQLKIYKRIHGPQGRRKPQRFSNQSDVRQSELQTETDLWR